MSTQSTGPSRLSRQAAKEVPHRMESRLFAAKASVTKAAEDLLTTVRKAQLHDAVRNDLIAAIERVQRQLHEITASVSGATGQVKDLAKQVQHLQLAEKWVAASNRVAERLGNNGSRQVRDALLEAQDAVLWCVRADHWDGQLTAAVKKLQSLTQDAEAHASRAV
jgi:hypothetical protein